MMIKKIVILFLSILLLNSCLKKEDYVPFEYTIRVYITDSDDIPLDNSNLKTLKINKYSEGKLDNYSYTYNRENSCYDFTGLDDGDYEIIVAVYINGEEFTEYDTIPVKEDKIKIRTIKFDRKWD